VNDAASTDPDTGLSLTLLVAGLFAPTAGRQGGTAPRLPALEKLLTRAQHSRLPAATNLEAAIFALYNATPEEEGDLPVAAVTRVLDLAVIDKGWWLRADPVHLSPQRDRLILIDASRLDISQDEANRLCAEISEVYKADGWLLKAPRPGRWYLKPAQEPKLITTPLFEVTGRDIHPYLPQGRDGKAWHTILNEVQILLHGSKVNEEREQQGKPPINSLWFWGGGRLPSLGTPGIQRTWSDEPLSLALARLTETPSHAPPANFDEWNRLNMSRDNQLIVLDRGRELVDDDGNDRWSQHLRALERDWFAPLLGALKKGTLGSLRLVADTGQNFAVTPSHARRWWVWPKPLDRHR
jgi:hypothetical protein